MDFEPDVTPEDREDEKRNLKDALEKLQFLRELAGRNSYNGPFREEFERLYSQIYDIVQLVEVQVADGFQFRDLEEIVVNAAPGIQVIYDAVKSHVTDEDAEMFLEHLIIFIYYELEPMIKTKWVPKWLLRFILRISVAKKLARHLKIALDFASDRADGLKNAVNEKVWKILDKIL